MKTWRKQQIKTELKMTKCAYCGDTENLTLDHKHPIILGGTDDKKNLQCLCKRCNQMKSGLPHGTLMKLFKWHDIIKDEKEQRKYDDIFLLKSKRLPDNICDLPTCSTCQKYRSDNGFPIKGRTK